MDIKQRDELAVKYFRETPETPKYTSYYIGIGVCALIFLMGSSTRGGMGAVYVLLGLIGLVISIRKFLMRRNKFMADYKWATPKATDQQMDQWLTDGRSMVIAEARKRLDLDESQESALPLVIDGPAKKSLIGKGDDRVLRFKRHNMLVIFLSTHHVATFQCTLDLGLGEILEDRTKEFPYKDITNLETQTSNDEFHFRGEQRIAQKGIQTLRLFTSGANVIEVNYLYKKNNSTDPEDFIYPPNDAEEIIRAIRKRLKEYKDRFSEGGQA
jgi:hypothetical protein